MKSCKQCGKEFLPPVSAPHKEFCASPCRVKWWKEWNTRARSLLAEREHAAEGKNDEE